MLILSLLIGLYIWLFKGKTLVFAYAVSGCIGVSLLLAMLISSAVGTCIPSVFQKNTCRSGSCIRSADHNSERSGCC